MRSNERHQRIGIGRSTGLAGLLVVFLSVAHAQAETEKWAPANCATYIQVVKPRETSEQWNTTSIGKMWSSTAMDAFHKERRQGPDGLLLDFWNVLQTSTTNEMAWVVSGTTSQQAVPGIVVHFPEDSDKDAIVRSVRDSLVQKGDSWNATETSIDLSTENNRRLKIQILDQIWIASPSNDVINEFIQAHNAESLANSPAFSKIQSKFELPSDEPHVFCYASPMRHLELHDAANSATAESDVAIATKRGYSEIDSISVLISVDASSSSLWADMFIHVPGKKRDVLELFRFGADFKGSVPILSEGASAVLAGAWKVPAAFRYMGPLFDETYADGIEGTFDDVLLDIKAEDGLGIDLVERVASLGPEANLTLRPMDDRMDWMVTATAHKDAKAKETMQLLFDGDPQMKITEHDNGSMSWQLASPDDPLDGLTAMLRGDQFSLSSSPEAVFPLVSATSQHSNPSTTRLEQLTKLDEGETSLKGIGNAAAFVRTGWTQLKEDQPTDEFSWLRFWGLKDQDTVYQRLPSFDQVAKHFNIVVLQASDTSDGWRIRVAHQTEGDTP
ncbi:hypothetical protein ACYFX5_02490 [Bremerella sp. T1]|uniref:hypothetical protein n=1 Tax=Bremerella sp. TYQ1 TaxID=3119568 RepID=UPI001CC8F4C4|nr:hypothetical protein [Bremerella volcania]UBM37138.1 hypothetical protein LA756_04445 [Bremerella volcania]